MSGEARTTAPAAVLGVLGAVGLALAGYFVGDGLYAVRASQRYVTVRGLAERDVPADLAIWPLVFTVAADDLEDLQRRIDADAAKIAQFLADDFGTDEWELSMPRITDNSLQSYPAEMRPRHRFAAESTLTVRSSRVDTVREAMRRVGDLVRSGVPIIRSYEYNTEFLFTGLESIKPEMIAEATRDARRAAEQFANDSGSRVGAIRTAQQGYFSIDDRDRYSPQHKKVRVVTTIEYLLE